MHHKSKQRRQRTWDDGVASGEYGLPIQIEVPEMSAFLSHTVQQEIAECIMPDILKGDVPICQDFCPDQHSYTRNWYHQWCHPPYPRSY